MDERYKYRFLELLWKLDLSDHFIKYHPIERDTEFTREYLINLYSK